MTFSSSKFPEVLCICDWESCFSLYEFPSSVDFLRRSLSAWEAFTRPRCNTVLMVVWTWQVSRSRFIYGRVNLLLVVNGSLYSMFSFACFKELVTKPSEVVINGRYFKVKLPTMGCVNTYCMGIWVVYILWVLWHFLYCCKLVVCKLKLIGLRGWPLPHC